MNFGAGPVSATVSGSGGNYSVSVSGNSGYAWTQAGSYNITVSILDKGGSQASVNDTITVTAPALAVTVSPPAFTEGIAATSVTVATFTTRTTAPTPRSLAPWSPGATAAATPARSALQAASSPWPCARTRLHRGRQFLCQRFRDG